MVDLAESLWHSLGEFIKTVDPAESPRYGQDELKKILENTGSSCFTANTLFVYEITHLFA
ncbi:hypothetical protein Glove_319g34 [Diversispora epigaea]|uniref:Uncharacterized protein n=1 Tax=Diversispora epigaea TaxID=1348612 RepID=A0A397HPH3_9GLOM|nr:hypothetical protein Glove_319g34 [Diversispora epigaea]